jgi:predicted O-methyltransferase YrrM
MEDAHKRWNYRMSKYKLDRVIGKNINILEIGVYKGETTTWFLTKLATHPKSKVYAIDTFEGTGAYGTNVKFSKIEQEFRKNINKTGKSKKVHILKGFSYDKLIELNSAKLKFHIIYIDGSHEASDVLSDAMLSWNMLEQGGIMIFDDYRWSNIKQLYFNPKIAIDSFISVMKPQLTVLHIGYKMVVQKRFSKNFEKPIHTRKLVNDSLYNTEKI